MHSALSLLVAVFPSSARPLQLRLPEESDGPSLHVFVAEILRGAFTLAEED